MNNEDPFERAGFLFLSEQRTMGIIVVSLTSGSEQ